MRSSRRRIVPYFDNATKLMMLQGGEADEAQKKSEIRTKRLKTQKRNTLEDLNLIHHIKSRRKQIRLEGCCLLGHVAMRQDLRGKCWLQALSVTGREML